MYARFPAYASPGSGNGTYLSDVRFATPRIGFVYGSTVLRTLDGGLTWRPLPYGGGTVLSLETDGSTVWVVTGACVGRPPDGACTGITVHRAGVTDASTSRVTVAQRPGSRAPLGPRAPGSLSTSRPPTSTSPARSGLAPASRPPGSRARRQCSRVVRGAIRRRR